EVLDGHCARVGRNPADIRRSIQMRVTYDDFPATRDALRPFIQAGANHLVLNLSYPYPQGIARQVASEIIQPLLEES
ncbi:MAG: LLM class F420-dependent oxidoreductase, partial [Ktedonobacterales bacterium]